MGSPRLGETVPDPSKSSWDETGLGSAFEDERRLLFFLFEDFLCFLTSVLSLDFPASLDLARFRDLLFESPTVVDEDFGLCVAGSKAECHELVSSEPMEEGFEWSMA